MILLGSRLEAAVKNHVTLILQFLSDMICKIIYQARSTLDLTSIFFSHFMRQGSLWRGKLMKPINLKNHAEIAAKAGNIIYSVNDASHSVYLVNSGSVQTESKQGMIIGVLNEG